MNVTVIEYMRPVNTNENRLQFITILSIDDKKYTISESHQDFSGFGIHEAMAFDYDNWTDKNSGGLLDIVCVRGDPGEGITDKCITELVEITRSENE